MDFDAPSTTQSTGSTKYLKLKDGESVNIILRGNVHRFFSIFGVKGEVSREMPGAKLRYKVNAIVSIEGKFEAKILEYGKMINDEFYKCSQVCDVTKTKLKLSCRGKGLKTEYFAMPIVNEPIPPAVMKQIEAVPLNMLDTKPPVNKADPGPIESFEDMPMPESDDDTLPF